MDIMEDNPFNNYSVSRRASNVLNGTQRISSQTTKGERLFMTKSLYFNDIQADCVTKILPTNCPESKTCPEKPSFMNVRNTFVSSPPSHSKQLA